MRPDQPRPGFRHPHPGGGSHELALRGCEAADTRVRLPLMGGELAAEEASDETLTIFFDQGLSAAGVYANGAVAWSGPHELTLDFYAGPVHPDNSQAIIVARIRLTTAVAAQLADSLLQELAATKTKG